MHRLGLLALIALLQSATPGESPSPGGERGPLKEAEVVYLLHSGVSPARVTALVGRMGVDFEATSAVLDIVRAAGGDAALLEALRAASALRPQPSASPPPSEPVPAVKPAPSAAVAPRTSPFEPEMVLVTGAPSGDFYLSRYEVANREYLAFCTRSGKQKPETPFWGTPENYPVVNVTWHDAVNFCRWLSLETGRRYRLPRDAEWEYGARGGRVVRLYPWGDEDPVGRSCFGKGAPCRIASFRPGAFGLYDMVGGVAEWCEDVYRPGAKARVVRGGSWASPLSSPELIAISRRDRLDPDKRNNEIGFRIAREP